MKFLYDQQPVHPGDAYPVSYTQAVDSAAIACHELFGPISYVPLHLWRAVAQACGEQQLQPPVAEVCDAVSKYQIDNGSVRPVGGRSLIVLSGMLIQYADLTDTHANNRPKTPYADIAALHSDIVDAAEGGLGRYPTINNLLSRKSKRMVTYQRLCGVCF